MKRPPSYQEKAPSRGRGFPYRFRVLVILLAIASILRFIEATHPYSGEYAHGTYGEIRTFILSALTNFRIGGMKEIIANNWPFTAVILIVFLYFIWRFVTLPLRMSEK